ncbi:hypothetical protein FE392_09145 [Xenorhabdus sp. 12]|uniref:N-acetyltransferase domain-containing protein n=1 Tax=Xenorhabdus santafensis TaxID=2582833 RepID=A0ABU4S9L6_9GAMM|nr:GNAT family N-acetyltransferase [Xenorhabdus sp. 12]MDX7987494.1 hypothetical protein [Xenorhabdus sp. 12]
MSEKNRITCQIQSVDAHQWNSIVYHWANAENWNLSAGDTARFFNVEPNGFFIVYRDNQPISSMSMVNYSDSYAFAGNFIIAPEFRNNVCGAKVWDPTIAYAEHRTIGMDGNWDRTRLYEKRGFAIHHRNVRLSGDITRKIIPPAGAVPITPDNIDEVIQYDAECVGVHRGALLFDWFWGKERYGFCTYSQTGISGVIGIRRSYDGYRIGPFHADNSEVLETLTLTALALVPTGESVSVDIPETNGNDFLLLAHEHGLRKLFHTYRMYKGNTVPKGRQDKVKATASLELG